MAEKSKSGGAGKFFLGALLGAAAGAIAGRFISVKADSEDEDPEECGCGGECEHCKARDEKIAKLKAEKKATEKKATEKKPAESKEE